MDQENQGSSARKSPVTASTCEHIAKRAFTNQNTTQQATATQWPDRLTRLPPEILTLIFESLDTTENFQALIASRQVSRVCQMVAEQTADYRFLVDSVHKIQRYLGTQRANAFLVYFRKCNYSRVVLRRSLRLAHTFQQLPIENGQTDTAFESLPIEWLLTQPWSLSTSKRR